MRKTIRKVASYPKEIDAKLWLRRAPDIEVCHKLPYQCQFPSQNLVREYLENGMLSKDDSNWRSFHFTSPEQVDYWSHRSCGAACIKMILESKGHDLTLADIVEKAVSLKGYDTTTDSGWFYKPLCTLLKQYNVDATAVSHLSEERLANTVHHGNVVIASVNPQIIRGDTGITSTKKSGHLVLVIGFRLTDHAIEGFYLHNPSGKTSKTQQNAYVPIKQFRNAFGQRGIVVTL